MGALKSLLTYLQNSPTTPFHHNHMGVEVTSLPISYARAFCNSSRFGENSCKLKLSSSHLRRCSSAWPAALKSPRIPPTNLSDRWCPPPPPAWLAGALFSGKIKFSLHTLIQSPDPEETNAPTFGRRESGCFVRIGEPSLNAKLLVGGPPIKSNVEGHPFGQSSSNFRGILTKV